VPIAQAMLAEFERATTSYAGRPKRKEGMICGSGNSLVVAHAQRESAATKTPAGSPSVRNRERRCGSGLAREQGRFGGVCRLGQQRRQVRKEGQKRGHSSN
jgi:hypothetical protein